MNTTTLVSPYVSAYLNYCTAFPNHIPIRMVAHRFHLRTGNGKICQICIRNEILQFKMMQALAIVSTLSIIIVVQCMHMMKVDLVESVIFYSLLVKK